VAVLAAAAMTTALAPSVLLVAPAAAVSPDLVISQVYGGGGNSGAPLTHDYVELFNRGTASVSLAGMSVQYASATGTGNFGANSTQLTELPTVTLQPGQYYLIQQAGGTTGSPLPTPDLVDTSPIAMAAGAGKVALATGATSLGCNGGSTPCSSEQLARIVDLVGYGNANFFEGSGAAPTLSNTTAALRVGGGCTDTDDNAADFSSSAPAPRNTASPSNACEAGPPVINEFVANHVGTDTHEFVEVRGAPDSDYSAYSVLQIEGDGAGAGVVDSVHVVGTTSGTGHWTTGFLSNALENGTLTLLLVENFTGAVGTDLDTNDDGTLDVTPWTAVADTVAVSDGGAGDLTYADTVLAPGFAGSAFTPGGASRIPDGADTDTLADWTVNDFDGEGLPGFTGTPVPGEALNTPGAPNALVPTGPVPGVTITESGGSTAVVEGGETDSYTLVLTTQPTADVTITVGGDAQVSVSPMALTFTPANWDVPQTVTVTAVDDDEAEGPHTGTVTHAAASADQLYDGIAVASVTVAITDNDVTDPCSLSYTPIYAIQGSGPAAAITGPVSTQGVVVGDYEGPSPALRGFYLQDPTGDGDPATSDGIFVFNGDNNSVNLGDVVRVTGTAGEFQDQTQVSASTVTVCSTGSVVAPTDVTFPVPSADDLEPYEGMLVRFPQTMYVTEHFQLGRFGQVLMSSGSRLSQPTNVVAPGPDADALQAANDLNKIIVDDHLQNQNPDPILFGRGGQPLSASNTLRGGDTATGMVGVMTYTWSGNAASGNAYRMRPVNALGGGVPDFQPANPRPQTPEDVGGTTKAGALNLLNYFNTFTGCTNGVGGAPTDCRGAENLTEFNRQWPKTVAAIDGMGVDVLGIVEIENDGYGPDSAIQDLVNRLNAASAPGTWAFVDVDAETGQVNALGTDAIKVDFIYKPAAVTPVGQTAALNTVDFVNGGDSAPRNRPALAQAFQSTTTGGVFVATVNHLKSKGSACDLPDQGDGQGNCNEVRTISAGLLADWLASDPTGTGDPDVLILGDLNSYAKEAPIALLESKGYTNLIFEFGGPAAYSYVFDGQWGYLDHALGTSSMTSQVTGVTEWHINADEPSVLDYNTNFKSPGQIASLYAPDQFRVSDHDPVIVGLDLASVDYCYADGAQTVDSYEPGLRLNGTPVPPGHADPSRALGLPDPGDDEPYWVTLGLGGEIVLAFDNAIRNTNGTAPDLRVVDVDDGAKGRSDAATVYASVDGQTWVDLGRVTGTGTVDLGNLTAASYVKVVDATPARGNPSADGYDLDAVEVLTGCA
jgi:uncharacterized protein